MKFTKILMVASAATLLAGNASAALELQLNTTTQEFALSGSDTGTPFSVLGGVVDWQIIGLGGSGEDNVGYNNDVAFSTSVGSPGNTFFGFDTNISASNGIVTLQLGMSSDVSQTLTGSGVFQTYSTMGAGSIAQLESAIGQNLSLLQGTGFSSVSVIAVPEPSTYAALAGLGMMVLTLICRRQRVARTFVSIAK